MTSSAGSTNQTICGTSLNPISYSIVGAYGAVVTGLPQGVDASYQNGDLTISGSPTEIGTFNYTVIPHGSCEGSQATGTITVNLAVTTAPVTTFFCATSALPTITHVAAGATAIGTLSWSPTDPGGITADLSGTTVTLSGTHTNTNYSVFNYTIPVTGSCGTVSIQGNINLVNAAPTVSSSLYDQVTVCLNESIIPISHSVSRVNSMGETQNLPPGVFASLVGNTLTLSGIPSTGGTYNYSIPLVNCVGTSFATGTIMVNNNCEVTNCSRIIEDDENVIIEFFGNCEWVVPADIDDFEILIIGGGDGGLLHMQASLTKVNSTGINLGDRFTITVGKGGSGSSDKNLKGDQGGITSIAFGGALIEVGGGGGGGSPNKNDGQGGDAEKSNKLPNSIPNGLSIVSEIGASGGGEGQNNKGKGRPSTKLDQVSGKNGGGHSGGGGGSGKGNGLNSNSSSEDGGLGGEGYQFAKFGSRVYVSGGTGGSKSTSFASARVNSLSPLNGGFGDGDEAIDGFEGEAPGSGGGGAGHDEGVSGGGGADGAVIISYPKFRITPVEVLKFDAQYTPEGREGKLSWTTAKEWENSHFEVERSINDVKNWKTIGEVDGVGYSQQHTDYMVIDKTLPASGGTVFYRFKQVDFSGKYSYSDTRAIRVDAVKGANSWDIYPNPTTGEKFSLELVDSPALEEGGVMASLSTMLGKPEVFNESNLEVLSQQVGSSLQNKAFGIYILTLTWSGKTESYRIIKN